MEGYLAFLLLKPLTEPVDPNDRMRRKLFPTEAACRAWIGEQRIPPFAFGWWIEAYDADGCVAWSQGVKSETV